MLVLNERTGSVMASRQFRTFQPSEGKNLRDSLEALQPGRVVIVVGLPDFLTFLSPEGEVALVRLGARMLPRVCTGEAWAMAAVTGSPSRRADADLSRGKVIAEAVATREYKRPLRSLFLEMTLERAPRERGCGWHEEAELKDQAEFCRSYEGYGDLCSCGRPLVPARRPRPPPISMAEEIPVAIVTANKPFHLYRLLKNLGEVAGSGETRVLVVVDGPHLETLHLARLFGVEVAVHTPQGLPGENTRTNMNIAFALYSVFSRWPHVDKAILLEDDLLLAPDILRYAILSLNGIMHCLGTDEQEVKEIYEGVLTFRVRPFSHAYAHDRTQAQSQDLAAQDPVNATLETAKARSLGCEKESHVLYIVGCPLSKYCKYSAGTSDWIAPSESYRIEADRVAMKRKTAGDLRTMRIRLTPKSASAEFNLTNFQDISSKRTG
ncbi:protein O-linked-mannose beta-1,2-N-acetylglucosaminyltransferase 1-like [Penaeus indicus]|uniref:protein O-linked-mannose beta-1,2-N-acetylglucosaminyltransferase 1-like n=1 Tax=Penaeus indicus TaxID=29960 RepID=UPI00300CD0B2